MGWESLSSLEVGEKLKELKFLNKFLLTEYLNNLEGENVSNNLTGLKDFTGQLELGTESKIPHYQLAIEMKSMKINEVQVPRIPKHFRNTSGKISDVIISTNLRSTMIKLSTHLMILQLSDQK